MNIVVVGTLNQENVSKLGICGRDADKIVFIQQEEDGLAQAVAGENIDLVLADERVDIRKLQGTLSQAGLNAPVFKMAETTTDGQIGSRFSGAGHPQAEHIDQLSIGGSTGLRLGQKLADVEKQLILETLTHCAGNRTWAAEILGISIRTLRNKLQQYSHQGSRVTAPGERRSRVSSAH